MRESRRYGSDCEKSVFYGRSTVLLLSSTIARINRRSKLTSTEAGTVGRSREASVQKSIPPATSARATARGFHTAAGRVHLTVRSARRAQCSNRGRAEARVIKCNQGTEYSELPGV